MPHDFDTLNSASGQEKAPVSSGITPIEKMLEKRSIDIVRCHNLNDISTPFDRYASKDFTCEHSMPNGQVVRLNAAEAIQFLRHVFRKERRIGQILSTSVSCSEEHGYASVFLSIAYHKADGDISNAREQVAVYSWRRQKVEGEAEEVTDWVWWKQTCASAVPSVPF